MGRWKWKDVRGICLFTLGAGLTIWDVTIYTPGTVDPPMLAFYGMLLGLELVLRGDEKRRNGKNGNGDH